MASAMGQLLEVASSLLTVGYAAAEGLIGTVIYGFGLLIKLMLACWVQVVEFSPAVLEFPFAAFEWIVTAFISGSNYLLTASFTVWYGLQVGSSAAWNGIVTGADIACSGLEAVWNGIVTGADIACSGLEAVWNGLVLLPDAVGATWNAFVTGTGFVWKGLVAGGGVTWQALVIVSIILWSGLKFAAIACWSVLTTSLWLLLSSFNALAYVTYELGFLIARVVQAGLRAAFSLPSGLFRVLESKQYTSLFHLPSWIDAIQNGLLYFYRYFHMVYTSFKLNVKFITELPALILPDSVSTPQIFRTILLIILAALVYVLVRKWKRKRRRNQTELMHRRRNITTERRPSFQGHAAHVPPTVSASPTSNQTMINRRKSSGSKSPGQPAGRGSEDTGVSNLLELRLRELELKLDREKEQQMCVVCLDHKRVWMLKPCNHYCVCDQCVHHLSNKCPICRKVIRNTERVFHA